MSAVLAAEVSELFPRDSFRNPIVQYQPIKDIRSGKYVFQEALARILAYGKMVLPSRFMQFAREQELLPELTNGVIRNVCHGILNFGKSAPPVTINIPYSCLNHETYRMVFSSLGYYHILPERLVIEITEDELVHDDEAADIFRTLSAIGVKFMLDDFSELEDQYESIRELPFFAVKIDRSVLRGHSELRLSAMLRDLRARNVETVVIEGVETREDEVRVLLMAADHPGIRFLAQGFYYGRPGSPHLH